MSKPNRQYDHVYAIIRVDPFQAGEAPLEAAVTVTKIVWDQAAAEREAARLNALNAVTGSIYFSQLTRLERPTIDPEQLGAPVNARQKQTA